MNESTLCKLTFISSFLFVSSSPLRHAPDIGESLVASLRSAVVLPANRLRQRTDSLCDSLSDGPFCSLISDRMRHVTGGLIDEEIWGGIPRRVYDRSHKYISDYAQTHWQGSVGVSPRKPHISRLLKANIPNVFHFSGSPPTTESSGFKLAKDGLYNLNSTFGYISFPKDVSIVEMRMRASDATSALIRTFHDGIPIWSRIVRFGQVIDIARECSEADPSIEAIDYIEIIGYGTTIESLSVSWANEYSTKTYVFMDSNLLKPSRYAGIRAFPPSAYLIDIETAVKEGFFFGDEPPRIMAAIDDPILSSDSLIGQLERLESDEGLPDSVLDYFILLLERREAEPDFEQAFRELLIESAPELIAIVLKPLEDGNKSLNDTKGKEFARRIRILRGDLTKDGAVPSLVSFHSTNDGTIQLAANQVALALVAHLGKQKFESIVLRHKLERLTNSDAEVSDGLDESALVAVITEGLGLPLNHVNKRSTLERIIEILLEGSPVASASQKLTDILLS
jgi:hypothetical protein